MHGHSIGHWEGDTLVVDTIGIAPQAQLPFSAGATLGIPNDGDMHVIEPIHLVGKDELHDDLEIIAPKVLTQSWKTTRILFRRRARMLELREEHCIDENFVTGKDKKGNDIFVPVQNDAQGYRAITK